MNVVRAVRHAIRDQAVMAVHRGTTDAEWVEVLDPNPMVAAVVNGVATGIQRAISFVATGPSDDGTVTRAQDDWIDPAPGHLARGHPALARLERDLTGSAHPVQIQRALRFVLDRPDLELPALGHAQNGGVAHEPASAVGDVIPARTGAPARSRNAVNVLG